MEVDSRIAELEASIRDLERLIAGSKHRAGFEASARFRKLYKPPCRGQHRWPKCMIKGLRECQSKALESRRPLIEKWSRKIEGQHGLFNRLKER